MPRAGTADAAPARRRGSHTRHGLLVAGGVLLLVLAVLASLAFGGKPLSFQQVFAALGGHAADYVQTVVDSRIPRTVTGLLVGGCLAVSGVVLQGITRNPLGAPGLLGVNVGAAASIVTALGFLGLAGVPTVWLAVPGAFLAMLAVYALGSRGRGSTPVRLVLAGAVISAVLTAYIQTVILTEPTIFNSYRYWVVGSLAGSQWDALVRVLPLAGVGLLLAVILAPAMNTLALGEAAATSLGANVGRTRAGGILAGTMLCAAATAVAGPIAFVGLAVPYVVRSLGGSDHRWQVPAAALLGPALVLFADVVGRVIMRPQELMVGVVTAFLGAPVLLLVLRRMRVPT